MDISTPKAKVWRMLEYRKWITRDMLRSEPDRLFVFEDNMARIGLGGQAAEMRGEPNAIGIPTKWRPGSRTQDFFTDEDLPKVANTIADAFVQLSGADYVVYPMDGVGTGLARLTYAPSIYQLIANYEEALRYMRVVIYQH